MLTLERHPVRNKIITETTYANRSSLYWSDPGLSGRQLGLHCALRAAHGGKDMNLLYLAAGLITLGLFVYLVLALLKPEWFG